MSVPSASLLSYYKEEKNGGLERTLTHAVGLFPKREVLRQRDQRSVTYSYGMHRRTNYAITWQLVTQQVRHIV